MSAPVKTFRNATEIVECAVANTKKKADIAEQVIADLELHNALAPWPGEEFVVWLRPGAERLTPTRTEQMPGGVEVDFWGTEPIAYRFGGGAEIEVTGS